GKTTLVNLLMRFYELDGGRILIDGRDIATMTRHDVRRRTGMVPAVCKGGRLKTRFSDGLYLKTAIFKPERPRFFR
ncbi:MAG: ATP-binding cassette domain-containing protein, partial [Neisseria elongata]